MIAPIPLFSSGRDDREAEDGNGGDDMSVYMVAMVRVHDPETYKQYTARTPALIGKHGGRFLVRGGEVETIEGPTFDQRLVVLEFPSREAYMAFYESPEYQEAMTYRQAASEATFLLVEGVPDGAAAPDDRVVKSG
jgi:uncharacterized protein (DUF1330 family)